MENNEFYTWLTGKIKYLEHRIEVVEKISPDHRNIIYFKVELNCYRDILNKYKDYGQVNK